VVRLRRADNWRRNAWLVQHPGERDLPGCHSARCRKLRHAIDNRLVGRTAV
jgi:hypothetical protein